MEEKEKKLPAEREPEDKYDILYVAKNLLLIERDFAQSAVVTYDALLRRIEILMANKPICVKDYVKDDLILALLSQLHRRYGGDRERFFSDADYRRDRMKCIGSDGLIYNELIRIIEEA